MGRGFLVSLVAGCVLLASFWLPVSGKQTSPTRGRTAKRLAASETGWERSARRPPSFKSKAAYVQKTPRKPRANDFAGSSFVVTLGKVPTDPAILALFNQMVPLLSQLTAIPNDRVAYYSAINQGSVSGWTGKIASVTASPTGGYTVTVGVSPVLNGNTQVWVVNDYSELYAVDVNSNVTYVGFTDPQGWAGTYQGFICY